MVNTITIILLSLNLVAGAVGILISYGFFSKPLTNAKGKPVAYKRGKYNKTPKGEAK